MRKLKYLLMFAMCLASLVGWASSTTRNVSMRGAGIEPSIITASVETVDFGYVKVGYNVTQRFKVTGTNLLDNLTLSISNDRFDQYSVSPSTITPENAEQGVTVTVKVSPWNQWGCTATLTASSQGADDLVIPITADIRWAECLPKYNEITAYAGWMSSISGTINIPDAEIPHDPNTPVVRSPQAGNMPLVEVSSASVGIADYSYEIHGDPGFGVLITKGSLIAKTCDVKIIYRPLTVGTHHATITFSCSRGGCPVTINVYGTAIELPEPGDIDGDGIFTIIDATGLIDILLSNDEVPPFADVDNDETVTIKDVTILIDKLLNSGN